MYLLSKKATECFGCEACARICPKNCITMVQDTEGFKYPEIDKNKCISCRLCEKTCPIELDELTHSRQAWAGTHISDETCFESSSGGAFTAICEAVIPKGYCVYGVKWTEDLKVVHDEAHTLEECYPFRKSKYVFSDMSRCFFSIETKLKNNEKVLFTGTPCQCGALIQYLKARSISRDGLLTVDLVCHGAPNQMIFDKYISELSCHSPVVSFQFRNKRPFNGAVNTRSAFTEYADGVTDIKSVKNDPFMKGYYGRLFYRPSCGECKFAKIDRCSDITIADAWDIEQIYPEFSSSDGCSMVLVNTENGNKLFSELRKKMNLKEVDVNWAEKANQQLHKPTEMHKGRKKFFSEMQKGSFKNAVNKATHVPFAARIFRKITYVLKMH